MSFCCDEDRDADVNIIAVHIFVTVSTIQRESVDMASMTSTHSTASISSCTTIFLYMLCIDQIESHLGRGFLLGTAAHGHKWFFAFQHVIVCVRARTSLTLTLRRCGKGLLGIPHLEGWFLLCHEYCRIPCSQLFSEGKRAREGIGRAGIVSGPFASHHHVTGILPKRVLLLSDFVLNRCATCCDRNTFYKCTAPSRSRASRKRFFCMSVRPYVYDMRIHSRV